MESLLKEVREYAFPPKEKTFFSVEGIIGHYENPTSDLLQFFMSQNEGHDLEALFLQAFFTCLKIDSRSVPFEGVKVLTRDKTIDRTFPDFVISTQSWVLVIENKINAPKGNPWRSYEEHAKSFGFPPDKTHLAILSKDGGGVANAPDWKGVSYQDYCVALKSEFTKVAFDRPISKWQVFAREFIVHLENKLYDPAMTMTERQRKFVENRLREIGDLKRLTDSYTDYLRHELNKRLQRAAPGVSFQFYQHFDGGELLKSGPTDSGKPGPTCIGGLRLDFSFWTPAFYGENSVREFEIGAWVKGLTEVQLQKVGASFKRNRSGNNECWLERRFANSSEAFDALFELAKSLFELCGVEPSVSPPTEAAIRGQ